MFALMTSRNPLGGLLVLLVTSLVANVAEAAAKAATENLNSQSLVSKHQDSFKRMRGVSDK